MKRCWIHIGMHKTGTTSLQRTLSSALLPATWHYVKLRPYINLGVPFFAMFSPDPTSYHWFGKKKQTHEDAVALGKKWKAELLQMVVHSNAEQFIFSGEGIALLCHQGLENMHNFLSPMFDEIRIVAYIRPPIGFRTSMFQQRIKMGRNSFDAVNAPLKYRSRFESFDEVFGREHVLLWKFDPKTFPDKCVVSDFCRRIDMRLDSETIVDRTNESLTREAFGMLFAYRKFGGAYGKGATVIKENKSIINALMALKGEKLRLAPSMFNQITPEDAQDVTWMETRLGTSLAETINFSKGGIATEEDLLTISRGACLSFVEEFEKLHGVTVPAGFIPETDPAKPEVVANLVAYCRSLYCSECLGKPRPTDIDNPGGKRLINAAGRRQQRNDVVKLNLKDLVDLAVTKNKPVLAAMSRKRGRALLKGVFVAIAENLQSLNPGTTIQVRGLGQFSITQPGTSGSTAGYNDSKSFLFVPDAIIINNNYNN